MMHYAAVRAFESALSASVASLWPAAEAQDEDSHALQNCQGAAWSFAA